jgi:hypothetical protein
MDQTKNILSCVQLQLGNTNTLGVQNIHVIHCLLNLTQSNEKFKQASYFPSST